MPYIRVFHLYLLRTCGFLSLGTKHHGSPIDQGWDVDYFFHRRPRVEYMRASFAFDLSSTSDNKKRKTASIRREHQFNRRSSCVNSPARFIFVVSENSWIESTMMIRSSEWYYPQFCTLTRMLLVLCPWIRGHLRCFCADRYVPKRMKGDYHYYYIVSVLFSFRATLLFHVYFSHVVVQNDTFWRVIPREI